MKGQVTIRDIAKKLNISVSTVSRALSDYPAININTRKIVKQAAQELNYQPNMTALNLRRNKTFTLGIIVPDLVTHFFSATISGIQNVAAEQGYNVMICQSNESFDTEVKNIQTLITSRVDGLLISLSKETTDISTLKSILNREIPLVQFDRISEELNISKVSVDDYEGAYKATEHLIEMGYKKIAHFSGPEQLSISKTRLQGYMGALKANNREISGEYIIHSTLTEEDIIHQTNCLIDKANPPDAIFAINDPAAVSIMMVLKKKGVKIPNEMGLVGFNNEPVTALVEPSLTSVAQPAYEIGQIAAKQILEQIAHPEDFIPQKAVLKTELVPRDSSRRG